MTRAVQHQRATDDQIDHAQWYPRGHPSNPTCHPDTPEPRIVKTSATHTGHGTGEAHHHHQSSQAHVSSLSFDSQRAPPSLIRLGGGLAAWSSTTPASVHHTLRQGGPPGDSCPTCCPRPTWGMLENTSCTRDTASLPQHAPPRAGPRYYWDLSCITNHASRPASSQRRLSMAPCRGRDCRAQEEDPRLGVFCDSTAALLFSMFSTLVDDAGAQYRIGCSERQTLRIFSPSCSAPIPHAAAMTHDRRGVPYSWESWHHQSSNQ